MTPKEKENKKRDQILFVRFEFTNQISLLETPKTIVTYQIAGTPKIGDLFILSFILFLLCHSEARGTLKIVLFC